MDNVPPIIRKLLVALQISGLTAAERRVVLLHVIEGLTGPEIAARLGRDYHRVRDDFTSAMAKLRDTGYLDDIPDDEAFDPPPSIG